MTFNSFNFLLFCILFFPLFFTFKKEQNLILIFAGSIFYGAWDYRYLALLYSTIFSDYYIAKYLYDSKNKILRKIFVTIGLFFNLGLLCFFKYYDFFAGNSNEAFKLFDIPFLLPLLNVILPVGISFYTLHSVGYLLDVYKKYEKPVFSFNEYAAFITFFPLLVAGPIIRINQFREQLKETHFFNLQNLKEGMSIFFIGLFQKVALADNLAFYADRFFKDPSSFNSFDAMMGIYSFAFQIYGDFAGYSNMAIGLGLIMGFQVPKNFNLPYFAIGIRDFWRRWHISLSNFFRDFVYIPLGGNRYGKTTRNLLITMGICGLWHGANFNMLFWGVFHGLVLTIEHLIYNTKLNVIKTQVVIIKSILIVITFHLVCFGWIIFRTSNLQETKKVLCVLKKFSLDYLGSFQGYIPVFALISCSILIDFLIKRVGKVDFFNQANQRVKGFIVATMLIILVLVGGYKTTPFIYFQF